MEYCNVVEMRARARACPGFARALAPSPLHLFLQTDVALIADDEVIDEFDVQVTPGLHELFGDSYILRRGRRVATGMIMADNVPRTAPSIGLKSHFRASGNITET